MSEQVLLARLVSGVLDSAATHGSRFSEAGSGGVLLLNGVNFTPHYKKDI